MNASDPALTDPDNYRVVFENDRVRVLEYTDTPGVTTHQHRHPDSVMITLSGFRRRVFSAGREVEVALGPGQVRWVGAQEHTGRNIGDTDSHAIFVELKEPSAATTVDATLGPS